MGEGPFAWDRVHPSGGVAGPVQVTLDEGAGIRRDVRSASATVVAMQPQARGGLGSLSDATEAMATSTVT